MDLELLRLIRDHAVVNKGQQLLGEARDLKSIPNNTRVKANGAEGQWNLSTTV